jgi:3,4-dihydroxy 2-butanone 4-phosphate synthase/GTP cyclohydrolase II
MSQNLKTVELSQYLSAADELIEEARNGRMFILVDDEDRENEGDLIVPAQFATPDAINFMARHARGLICLALTRQRVEQLGLPLMAAHNGTRHQTAFTISIEAREGVTPGHVFPLMAREGGTLVRAGHTEASVDIARKAGLYPAAVICEIMNDDGTMARLPDLVSFAQRHNLKLGSIADLIAHRRLTERLVKRVAETAFQHVAGGEWRAVVYANTVEYQEHLVLVKGDVGGNDPVMVRMHAVDLLDDMTGGPHWIGIHNAMHMISNEGRGVVVLIREHRKTALAERRPQRELRDYGIGAQILLDLGVKNMVLLSNSRRTIIGLDGYGLNIVAQKPIPNIVGEGYSG